MSYTEKLMTCAMIASLMASAYMPCLAFWRSVSTKQAPVVAQYQRVYQSVSKMAEHIGE